MEEFWITAGVVHALVAICVVTPSVMDDYEWDEALAYIIFWPLFALVRVGKALYYLLKES